MAEKIYAYNKLTNTLQIKGFCAKSSTVDKELFEAGIEVIKGKGKN